MSKKPPTLWADCPDLTGCLKPALAALRPPEPEPEVETLSDEEVSELALAIGTQLAAMAEHAGIHPWYMAQALGVCAADALRACDDERALPAWREFAEAVAEALIRPTSDSVN
jgi:hypothetical protein